MALDDLGLPAKVIAQFDQVRASAETQASVVAAFYKHLLREGVPDSTVEAFTLEWMRAYFFPALLGGK